MMLVHVLVVEVALIAILLVTLIAHAAVSHLHARRVAPRLEAARTALIRAMQGARPSAADLVPFTHLSRRQKIAVLTDIARSLHGGPDPGLTRVFEETGVERHAARACRARRAWRRLQGVRLYTYLGGGERVVPSLVTDRDPLVRAQAAEWCGDHPTADHAAMLMACLGDRARAVRVAAMDALVRMGPAAVPAVRRALDAAAADRGTDVVALQALLRVAAALVDSSMRAPLVALVGHADGTMRAGAARALGALGGPHAQTCLAGAVSDPDAHVRATAARMLGAVGPSGVEGPLAALLDDPDRRVAAAAARTLACAGGRGRLLLRRRMRGDDAAARTAAQALMAEQGRPLRATAGHVTGAPQPVAAGGADLVAP